MKQRFTHFQVIAVAAILGSLAWFDLVVIYWWVANTTMPTDSRLVIAALSSAGPCIGFIVAVLANVALRAGPTKLRLPGTVVAWIAFNIVVASWLWGAAADPTRLSVAATSIFVLGLICGPYSAEIVVGLSFYKRQLKTIDTEIDRRLAEIQREGEHKRAELTRQLRQFEAEQAARAAERERNLALRNYFRS
jgi:hypothetical protein